MNTLSLTIEQLQAEIDRLVGLLGEVADGYVHTSRNDIALIVLPLDAWLEVERAAGDSALARERAAFLGAGFVLEGGAWRVPHAQPPLPGVDDARDG
jgi:hypothetical protein